MLPNSGQWLDVGCGLPSAVTSLTYTRPGIPAWTLFFSKISLVLQQHKEAVDEIPDQGLRAETNGQSRNPGAGQHGSQVEAQQGKDLQGGHEQDDKCPYAVDDCGQGLKLLGAKAGWESARL